MRIWAGCQVGFGLFFAAIPFVGLPEVDFRLLPLALIGLLHGLLAAGIWSLRRWSLWLGLIYSVTSPLPILLLLAMGNILFPRTSGPGPGGPGMGLGSAITFVLGLGFFGIYWIVNVVGFANLLSTATFEGRCNSPE